MLLIVVLLIDGCCVVGLLVGVVLVILVDLLLGLLRLPVVIYLCFD